MGIFDAKIVFHDRAGGGWYCNECKQYIHPDMVHSHNHTGLKKLAHPIKHPNKTNDGGSNGD